MECTFPRENKESSRNKVVENKSEQSYPRDCFLLYDSYYCFDVSWQSHHLGTEMFLLQQYKTFFNPFCIISYFNFIVAVHLQ